MTKCGSLRRCSVRMSGLCLTILGRMPTTTQMSLPSSCRSNVFCCMLSASPRNVCDERLGVACLPGGAYSVYSHGGVDHLFRLCIHRQSATGYSSRPRQTKRQFRIVDESLDGARQRLGVRLRQRSEEHTSELQSRENLVC